MRVIFDPSLCKIASGPLPSPAQQNSDLEMVYAWKMGGTKNLLLIGFRIIDTKGWVCAQAHIN